MRPVDAGEVVIACTAGSVDKAADAASKASAKLTDLRGLERAAVKEHSEAEAVHEEARCKYTDLKNERKRLLRKYLKSKYVDSSDEDTAPQDDDDEATDDDSDEPMGARSDPHAEGVQVGDEDVAG